MMSHEPIPYELVTEASSECRYCRVPVDGPGDVCAFCATYTPPPVRPEFIAELLDVVRDSMGHIHVMLMELPDTNGEAGQYTRAAIDAITDAITAVTK